MSLVRVQHVSISLDGFATGEGQSLEAPFGHAGHRLHTWVFETRWGRRMFGGTGGTAGVDDAFLRLFADGIGAEIMGANKFGPPGWQEDTDWRGWWGPNPPFHTPVFVLTHRPRPLIEMEGGTTSTSSTLRRPGRWQPPARLRAVATFASAGAQP